MVVVGGGSGRGGSGGGGSGGGDGSGAYIFIELSSPPFSTVCVLLLSCVLAKLGVIYIYIYIYMGQCPAESPFWLVFQVFDFH